MPVLESAGASVRSFVKDLIVIAFMIAVLIAAVAWMKASPDTFKAVISSIGNTVAAAIIAGCDALTKWLNSI